MSASHPHPKLVDLNLVPKGSYVFRFLRDTYEDLVFLLVHIQSNGTILCPRGFIFVLLPNSIDRLTICLVAYLLGLDIFCCIFLLEESVSQR